MKKTHIRTRENLYVMDEDGQYVAFDPEEGGEWKLNETGAFIIKNLMQGASLEEIKEKILKEYEVDPEEIEEILQQFIEYLRTEGIVLED